MRPFLLAGAYRVISAATSTWTTWLIMKISLSGTVMAHT